MRVAVLGAATGWHVGRLVDALRAGGHESTVVGWHELATDIGVVERHMPEAVDRADVIVVRGMPVGTLEDVIFRMDLLGRLARGRRVVNAPRALEVAIDKYLTLTRLRDAGIPVPRTIVAQNEAGIVAAWQAFGEVAVVKPLFGSQGRGIERVVSRQELGPWLGAARAAEPPGAVCYLQEFIPHHGWDARVFVIGDQTFAMRRVSTGDWRINVSRGARPEPWTAPADWEDLAIRSARAVGAEIAGVDLLPANPGPLVVEVNAVPGWRGLESALGRNIAAEIVAYLAGPRDP
ncbi:MAG: RimK family alpha-L-glutamate ligase [Planctomycetia bacterium]